MRSFFPLRSNAASLLAGAPVSAVIARIKLAALLGDVVLEDGTYRVQAGPDGSFSSYDPAGSPGDLGSWQPPRERSAAVNRDGFYIAVGGPDGPLQAVVQSKTSLRWTATYGPLKRGLASQYQWLQFGSFELTSAGSDKAKRMADIDQQLGILVDKSSHVRSRILGHVGNDSVVAAGLGAALVVDRRHAEVMRQRLARGHAHYVAAFEAAQVLEPHVALLSWDDIDHLRKLRGWQQLREVWAEVGELALECAASPAELERMIQQDFRDRLTEAALVAEGPRGLRRWLGPLSGLVLGALPNLAALSPAVSLGAGAVANVAAEVINYSQTNKPEPWVAAASALSSSVQKRLLTDGDAVASPW